MQLVGNWQRALLRLTGLEARIGREVARVSASIGQTLVDEMLREMRASSHPPLHWFTVAEKGSAEPLVATGRMESQLAYRVEDGGFAVWAGVAGDRAWIARIQEYGVTIRVTDPMRAYLHGRGLHLAADTSHIVIPPRPFVGPAFRRVRGVSRGLLWRAFREALFGGAR